MLSIGPPGSCCWISSIVQLPMFYEVGATLYGTMNAMTSDLYEPLMFNVVQGRDIEIKPGFTKYKIELCINGEIDEVVGIALAPFDPNGIMSDEFASIPFFPVYIHCGRECYLFMESINDLFRASGIVCSQAGTNSVVSAMDVIKRIGQCYHSGIENETGYDYRYARLAMHHNLLEFLMLVSYPEREVAWGNGETTLHCAYGILDTQIPLSIQLLGNIRYVAQLRPFLNPYGNVPSDIARAAITTVQNDFDRIKETLQLYDALPDKVGDIFSSDPEDFSFTGKWLSLIFQNEFSNFSFPVRQDERNVSDVYLKRCHEYENFRHSFERMYSWNDLSTFLLQSLQFHNALNLGDCTVYRSWLEDIVVRDAHGEIVVYADMVLLILMCAEGLINSAIVDQLVPLIGVNNACRHS